MTVFRSIHTLDPFHNLATERAFFERIKSVTADFHSLLVWRNARCVVIGRHQNPWIECDLAAMNAAGVPFARRVSGGGTVYHDPGNLNYSFIGTRDRYELDRHFEVVVAALAGLGIAAHRTERNDIVLGPAAPGAGGEGGGSRPEASGQAGAPWDSGVYDGRKISGSAFRHTRNASLHHGTLLISADLAGLKAFLPGQPDAARSAAGASEVRGGETTAAGTPAAATRAAATRAAATPSGPPPQLVTESKAIASVRSRVANLADVRPGLTYDDVALALRRAYARVYGSSQTAAVSTESGSGPAFGPGSAREIARYEEELRSWEWRFGKTPAFTMNISVPATATGSPWYHEERAFVLQVVVRHGRIAAVTAGDGAAPDGRISDTFPDPVLAEVAATVGAAVDGARFDPQEIETRAVGLTGEVLAAALAIAASARG